ncbi:hypothetical protein [Streptosporangium vulgare]|uniref:hypothetical protein n=1 Tax=Streptosporangium vulgare TaxID=46190 RepID=UPI0031D356FC
MVLGPNGPGRPRCLSLAAAVRHPTEGPVTVLGQRLGRVDLRELRPPHRPRRGRASGSSTRSCWRRRAPPRTPSS